MIIEPYTNDPLFADGLTALQVDKVRFDVAINSLGTPRNKKILDIGAYPGTGYERFSGDNEYTAYGIIEGEFKKKLEDRSIKFISADIQDVECFSTDADIVLFQEIIEHIRTPKSVLTKIYEGMKVNSVMYITTNNSFYYGYILKLILGRQILDPIETENSTYPGHCRYYSANELSEFFIKLGADIRMCRNINFLPSISCYKIPVRPLAIIKKILSILLPDLYSTHIELVIHKP